MARPLEFEEQHSRSTNAKGLGLLAFSAALLLWALTVILRYTSGAELMAGLLWIGAALVWLVLQSALARGRVIERLIPWFPTLVQVALPILASLAAFQIVPTFESMVITVATQARLLELTAIHILRLAAWGTIRKYRQGLLPRYFFVFGSLPDFGFAIAALVATLAMALGLATFPTNTMILMHNLGVAVFLGAGVSMYFGVVAPGLGIRTRQVAAGTEPSTVLPFQWPMNMAPAFCVPMFIQVHFLALLKLTFV